MNRNASTIPPEQGATLRAAREGAGVTVYALAKQAGVSQTHVHRFEAGERGISLAKYEHLQAAIVELLHARQREDVA